MASPKSKRPQRDRSPWKPWEVRKLKQQAASRTCADIAVSLRRTAPAVQQFAMRHSISFRA